MPDMNEYTPELYELIDENGNKQNFEMLDAAELDGVQYFAMIPAIESEEFLNDDGELVILKAIEDNGEEILASIDDDDEFEEYRIVGSKEADPSNNKISNESPLALAIMNAKAGEVRTVESPNGSYDVEILEIY